jgi:hypothetical protein
MSTTGTSLPLIGTSIIQVLLKVLSNVVSVSFLSGVEAWCHYLFTSKEKYVSEETLPFLPGLAENRIPSLGLYHSPEATTTDNPSIKPHVHGLNSYQVLYGTEHEGKPHDIKYDLTVPTPCSPNKTYKLNIHTILSFHLVPLTTHINLTYILS